MEPEVIRMYSSSPPPMEDAAEEEDDEFGDFGTFSDLPNSISFSELETPTTFDQNQALAATSPPEVHNGGGPVRFGHAPSIGGELSKANGPSGRTETRKSVSPSPTDCNGEEVLTNGFVTLDLQGSPSPIRGPSIEDSLPVSDHDFADFASFSNCEGTLSQRQDCPPQTEDAVRGEDTDDDRPARGATPQAEDALRDAVRGEDTDDDRPARGATPQTEDALRDAVRGEDTDNDCPARGAMPQPSHSVCTNERLSPGGTEDEDESREAAGTLSDEKSSETETSLGRPLSADALDEFGDASTTCSAPSPPLRGDAATPPEDEEDFGAFGDAGSFGNRGFKEFEDLEVQSYQNSAPELPNTERDDDFGDFDSPGVLPGAGDGGTAADFPSSDSFGNFSSARSGEEDSGWSAFGQNQSQEEDGESWAAFSSVPSVAPPADGEEEEWDEGPTPAVGEEAGRTEPEPVALSSRLEKLFLSSFPRSSAHSQLVEDQVETLKVLLEPGSQKEGEEEEERWARGGGVWTQLQDVHEALGLRYQWGGSHCNKVLLCCLGIDTRNILFTGQRKQPVIVPMYAAGLGMLEPTKEPVKPVSAAEMIASIAQTPPAATDESRRQSEPVQQEALPPVQFDWSSSGLTNPLDASGGSALLNLDFFGPVEDSGSSSSASIPGVDPELFELTTAKLDPGGAGGRVADAFARLMSTMDKTSTSARKPRKDENLSEEASKVISALPDLSFMQAKVLMFPATLTPLCSQATPD